MLLVHGRFISVFRTSLAFDAGSFSVIDSVSEKAVGEGGLVGIVVCAVLQIL
jgi:hypothetical protein